MYCSKCGTQIPDGAFCPACGSEARQANYQSQAAGKGEAIASLVLGIAAIIFPIPFVNLILGIVGLVMTILSGKKGYVGGIRTAGLVLSIIGIVLAVLLAIAVIIAIVLATTHPDFGNRMWWHNIWWDFNIWW